VNIVLNWRGSIALGNFPTDTTELEEIDAPGVYLRLKSYDGGRSVQYVGQSKSVLMRIDQHITALLSLQYPLRNAKGDRIGRGDFTDRIKAYNDIEKTMALVAADAARMRFFFAPCDDDSGFLPEHLNLVEGALKTRLEQYAAQLSGLASVENIQGVPASDFDGTIAIESTFDLLQGEDHAIVSTIIGDQPMGIPEAALGLGHAE
jgi:hypothetical protein